MIGALIGLVGACSSNPKTENTDAIIITALSLAEPCCDERTAREQINAIHAEKYAVAPSWHSGHARSSWCR